MRPARDQEDRPHEFRAVAHDRHRRHAVGCGVNSIPTAEENAKARWADVQNQYQRRADLIPNLVATVKGAGAQEKSILVDVTQARAAATRSRFGGDLTDPAKVAAYQRAQAGHHAVAAAAAGGLSRAQEPGQLHHADEPARRHREPDHHRAQRLQQRGAGV